MSLPTLRQPFGPCFNMTDAPLVIAWRSFTGLSTAGVVLERQQRATMPELTCAFMVGWEQITPAKFQMETITAAD